MDDTEIEFIEQLGLMSKNDGMPRIAGRIYGLMLLREGPLCLDDIAELLQVSKGSVSTNARRLERMGILERTGKPGDRKDYYRASPDAIEGSFERARQRMESMLQLLETTLPRLPDDNDVAQQRLRKMRNWHAFLLQEMEGLLQRWEQSQNTDQIDDVEEEKSP